MPDTDHAGIAQAERLTLDRLADALGCPVGDFADQFVALSGQTVELLRLWNEIADTKQRAKILAFVKDMCGSSSNDDRAPK